MWYNLTSFSSFPSPHSSTDQGFIPKSRFLPVLQSNTALRQSPPSIRANHKPKIPPFRRQPPTSNKDPQFSSSKRTVKHQPTHHLQTSGQHPYPPLYQLSTPLMQPAKQFFTPSPIQIASPKRPFTKSPEPFPLPGCEVIW
jgi:hypothetical protein